MYKNTLEVYGYEYLPKFDSPRLRSLRMDSILINLLSECRALKIFVRSTLRNATAQNFKNKTKDFFSFIFIRFFVRRFQQVRYFYWLALDPSCDILSYAGMLFYSDVIRAPKSANRVP